MSSKVPPSPPPLDSRPLVEWQDDQTFNNDESNHDIDEFNDRNAVSTALDFNSADNNSVKSLRSNKSGSSAYVYPVGSAMQVARNRQ
jgi:hypothetical protein